MTGNTVLLAIRMMGSTEKSPLLAGVSLLGFVVSGLISGQVGAIIGGCGSCAILAIVDAQATVEEIG